MTSIERREAIIDAAINLFSEKGFRGTTTRELAAAVGVSEPILYQHFTNKRDLYAAIVERKSLAGEDRIEQMLGPCRDGCDDEQFFLRLGQMMLGWYTEDPAYIRILLFCSLESKELGDLFYDRQCNSFFHVVVEYIERRIRDGAFRDMNAGIVAGGFISMVAHFAQNCVIWQKAVAGYDREEVVRSFVNIFLHGVSSSKRES